MKKTNTQPQKIRTLQDEDIQRYINDGDSAKVNKLISMAYLMMTIANAYNEEAIEILEKYQLVKKKIKTRMVNLRTAFELYDKQMFELIHKEEGRRALCLDYDIFKKMCDDYMEEEDYKKLLEKAGLKDNI